MKKIICRIKGGLGNQLFCYAASRRLAVVNQADLAIDNVTGFARDYQYRRKYALHPFQIPVRLATPAERLEPFERYRRGAVKWISNKRPFAKRFYIEQEGLDFEKRLLTLKVRRTIYLDGYWQSEGYFKDIEEIIRKDLRIIPPTDSQNIRLADKIRYCLAVALHVRWFDAPGSAGIHNISSDYYQRSIDLMERKLESPHFFLFSDDPVAARAQLNLPSDRVTFISHNRGDENAYADMWLMTLCRHFIIANSTFSWWGAWLGGSQDKIVVCPATDYQEGSITSWNFTGLIPDDWIKI